MKSCFLCTSGLLLTVISTSAATRVLQAFEGDGFGTWKVEGTAFGLAPVPGRCDGLTADLEGFSGDSLACSAHGKDAATGSLTSEGFPLSEDFLAFLIAGGSHAGRTAVQLLVDGAVVLEATGRNSLQCRPVVWDVSKFRGKTGTLRIVDSEKGSWGVIAADHFMLTDSKDPVFPPRTVGGEAPVELVASAAVPGLTLPAGTTATIVADFKRHDLTSPTALTFGEQGELYVSETHRFRHGVPDNRDHLYWYMDDIASRTTADRMRMYEKWQGKEAKSSLEFLTEKQDLVRVLGDRGPDGVFRRQEIFAGGFNEALDGPAAGVFAYEGTVFTACIPKIYALRDPNGDGKAEVRDVIQDGFGVRVSFSGHDLNGFVLGPDGRIYGTLGDRGLNFTTREGVHYEMPDEGCVFRFDPDGTNFEIIHTGLRNPKEIAFDEFGNAISVDNNCDQGDKARVVYVVDGGNSGWHMGHQGLLVHHKQMGMAEQPPAAWMAEKMWETANPAQPAFLLPPVDHLTSGPSGLTYHPGTGFLESEAGRFLICDYRGGAGNSGIWSFRVEPAGASMKMTGARKFNWGAAVTDVEYSWDGRVTVTDFIGGWASHADGRVYEVTADTKWKADEAAQVAELVREGFERRSPAELARLLTHPDMRVRLRAEMALSRKPEGLETFTRAARQTNFRLARLHGVWGLGIIARRVSAVLPGAPAPAPDEPALREKARLALAGLVDDDDTEVRAAALKALGESGLHGRDVPFARLIREGSPRVKLFAAIAAGRLKETAAVPAILEMLDGNEDPYLRHAGSFALSLLQTPVELAALKSHSAAQVRMAAVIALRRLDAPQLTGFLADSDRAVAEEAIRAINDRNLVGARAEVAALLDQPAPADRTVMIWRRLLHSAFRTGGGENAGRLLKVALDSKVPDATRKEAFRLLAEWRQPHLVDQSTGRIAQPLAERQPEEIRTVLAANVTPLVGIGGNFLQPALALVQEYRLDLSSVPDETLKSLVLNEKVPGDARVEGLSLYADREPAGLDELLVKLAGSKNGDLAIGALRRLATRSPDTAAAKLAESMGSGSARRRQEAWKLAGEIDSPRIPALFEQGLADLQKNNGISPAALELLAAAESRKEPAVQAALGKFRAAQAAAGDPLTPFHPALEGGDAENGGKLFESHPAGQCMRCHASGHGGGDAGPNLSGVGLRGDRRFFLESLVNPGAKVAMGYGIASVTLKGGKSVSGIVIADTPDHVDLDSSGKVLRVLRSDIDTMTPPMSAMPPMGALLSAPELRDLIAWLAGQKHDTREEKKRPAPERVEP